MRTTWGRGILLGAVVLSSVLVEASAQAQPKGATRDPARSAGDTAQGPLQPAAAEAQPNEVTPEATQEPPRNEGATAPGHWFTPVFLLQPGMFTANAVKPPDGAMSSSELNLRFLTVLPTPSKYLVLVSGLSFQPLADGAGNSPAAFYGLIVPLPFVTAVTHGWIGMSLDAIGLYAAGLGATMDAPTRYGHELLGEVALQLNIGPKLFSKAPDPISGMNLYVLADQLITGPNDFNPALLYGITVPLAPWSKKK